jgi:hypothetical protein
MVFSKPHSFCSSVNKLSLDRKQFFVNHCSWLAINFGCQHTNDWMPRQIHHSSGVGQFSQRKNAKNETTHQGNVRNILFPKSPAALHQILTSILKKEPLMLKIAIFNSRFLLNRTLLLSILQGVFKWNRTLLASTRSTGNEPLHLSYKIWRSIPLILTSFHFRLTTNQDPGTVCRYSENPRIRNWRRHFGSA